MRDRENWIQKNEDQKRREREFQERLNRVAQADDAAAERKRIEQEARHKKQMEAQMLAAAKAESKRKNAEALKKQKEERLMMRAQMKEEIRQLKLKESDEIAGLEMLEDEADMLLLTVTENGYGKRTAIEKYRVQGRGGQGVINMVVDERNGRVVGSAQVNDDDQLMMMTNTGRVIKIPVTNIRETQSRAAKGVRVMRVEKNERIVSVTRVVEQDEELDEGVIDQEESPVETADSTTETISEE